MGVPQWIAQGRKLVCAERHNLNGQHRLVPNPNGTNVTPVLEDLNVLEATIMATAHDHGVGGEQDTSLSGLRGTQLIDLVVPGKDRKVSLIKTNLLNKPGDLIKPRDAEQDRHIAVMFRPQEMLDEVDQCRGLPNPGIETGEEEAGWRCPVSHSRHHSDRFSQSCSDIRMQQTPTTTGQCVHQGGGRRVSQAA
jgi:hypothetical protein